MSFTLPTFPLDVGVWHPGHVPPAPPDAVVKGNLAYGKRVSTQFWDWATTDQSAVFAQLLLPPLTDVRDFSCALGADVVEVPLSSGRFYSVQFVDDLGKGFPNEHRFALLAKDVTSPWPTPIP